MLKTRVVRELKVFNVNPPPGISLLPHDGDLNELDAIIVGPPDTPYEEGSFKLKVSVPVKYPIRPPLVRFTTPIYHPNVDGDGRICLDILNMPPKGGWRPSINIEGILKSLQLLMSTPNPDDALEPDIARIYVQDRALFNRTARLRTRRNALQHAVSAADLDEEDETEDGEGNTSVVGIKRARDALSQSDPTEPPTKRQKVN